MVESRRLDQEGAQIGAHRPRVAILQARSRYRLLALVEALVVVAFALCVLTQVGAEPVVGLADNHDFGRLTRFLQLRPSSPGTPFRFAEQHWIVDPASGAGLRQASSQVVLGRAALGLSAAGGSPALFDVRVLGVVTATLHIAAFWLVVLASRRLPLAPRLVLVALGGVVFSDVAYVAYFNSFYSEPAVIVYGLALVALAALWLRDGHSRWPVLGGFFAAAAGFIMAKPQMAPLGPVVALYGLGLWRRTGPVDGGRRVVVPLLVAAVLAASVWPLQQRPAVLERKNVFNAVFHDLLPASPDPAADLVELGTDPALVHWSGTNAHQRGNPVRDPGFRAAFAPVHGSDIARFYLRHPARLWAQLVVGARGAGPMRPDYLGNYDADAGLPPFERTAAYARYSDAKALAGSLPFVMPVTLLLGLCCGATAMIRRRSLLALTTPLGSVGVLALMAALAFGTVLVGEGTYELVKHLLAFHLLFDLCLIALVVLATTRASLAARSLPGWWRARCGGTTPPSASEPADEAIAA